MFSLCAAQALGARRPMLGSKKRLPCGISFPPSVAVDFPAPPFAK
jgi:hypothetical protein